MKTILLLIMMLVTNTTTMLAQESLRLPQFFADGMVVQRGEKIPVWGWGTPGDKVSVVMNGKSACTTVGKDGTWRVQLPKMEAGGPYKMNVLETEKSKAKVVVIDNVLVGDVFLCSGQSNMELPIRRCMDVVADEVADYSNDQIRYLKLPHQFNYVKPNDDVKTLPWWQDITPQNCSEVSGICYFMARELQERYKVPIGIINSAVGGTQVQAWMPRDVLATFDGYEEELAKRKYHQENWVDSIRTLEDRAGREWEREMTEKDTVVCRWRQEDYDFSAWQRVDMFADWSRGKNGSYWFRTMVTLPSELEGKAAILRFGAMKDADSIFVNGVFVGNTTYEYPPRIYKVKDGILKAGENEVVVHLMSQSGRPNFTNGKLYQLEVGELVFKIDSELQMAVGCTMPRKPASTYFVDTPTGLYNAMIAPFAGLPIKGMLWYQGESNLGQPNTYAAMLEAMVKSWRKQFRREFPVVIMQLPGYMAKHEKPVETGWTRIRHQQYMAALQIDNAALAPTIDTGEYNDIHPQDKLTAGHRAALQMSRLAYGDNTHAAGGPQPLSAKVENGVMKILFDNDGYGTGSKKKRNLTQLVAKGGKLNDFAILVDGKYQWAAANITGTDEVSVSLPEGISSTTVRYCWDDYPQPTLFNSDGIPAPQFEVSSGQ